MFFGRALWWADGVVLNARGVMTRKYMHTSIVHLCTQFEIYVVRNFGGEFWQRW